MKSLMLKLAAALTTNLFAAHTFAYSFKDGVCKTAPKTPGCPDTATQNGLVPGQGKEGYLGNLLDVFIYVAAAVALIFIIVGAIRYMTSTGDASRIQQAKDIVFYAIIGLVVAILARLIVGFVIGSL